MSKESLSSAAKLLLDSQTTQNDAEIMLARAVEHGSIPAEIQRTIPETWDAHSLPGNLDPEHTMIETEQVVQWVKRGFS